MKICVKLIWVCIYDVFKDEYFLYYVSLPCLKLEPMQPEIQYFSKAKTSLPDTGLKIHVEVYRE